MSAPPVEEKSPANAELLRLLASELDLREQDVEALQSGDAARLMASGLLDATPNGLSPLLLAPLLRTEGEDHEPVERDVDEALVESERDGKALAHRLAEAESMIGYLSAVFGACRVCWGASDACPVCAGSGGPGSAEPMKKEVLLWVEPILERLGMRIAPKLDAANGGREPPRR
jgi:hypothetical protein